MHFFCCDKALANIHINQMGRTERFLGILIIALMIIQLQFYHPILDTAIIFLTIILALIYFALSFALLNNIRLRKIFNTESYNSVGILRVVGAIFTGFILSIICIFTLFQFMHWPFANQGLIFGLISLIIPAVIVAVKLVTTKETYYRNFLVRLLIFGIIGVLFYFTSAERIFEYKDGYYTEFIQGKDN